MDWWRKSVMCAVGCLAAMAGSAGATEPVTLVYNVRPPYKIQTEEGGVGGLALAPLAQAFRRAKLPFLWQEMPASRQLAEVAAGTARVCAVGFYSTPDRRRMAKFIGPSSRDGAEVVVARKGLDLAGHATLAALLADPGLTMVVKQSNSYGQAVDDAIAAAKVHVLVSTNNMDAIIQLVTLGRVDFTLMTFEEVEFYRRQGLIEGDRYQVLKPPDVPPEQLRYALCSKAVEDEVISRVNAALELP